MSENSGCCFICATEFCIERVCETAGMIRCVISDERNRASRQFADQDIAGCVRRWHAMAVTITVSAAVQPINAGEAVADGSAKNMIALMTAIQNAMFNPSRTGSRR